MLEFDPEVKQELDDIRSDIRQIRKDMPKRIPGTWIFTAALGFASFAGGCIWWASDINANVVQLNASVKQMAVGLEKLSDVAVLRGEVNATQREMERLEETVRQLHREAFSKR